MKMVNGLNRVTIQGCLEYLGRMLKIDIAKRELPSRPTIFIMLKTVDLSFRKELTETRNSFVDWERSIEMELSKTQKQLLSGLKVFGMTEEETTAVMLTLRTEKQMNMMINYMLSNQQATTEELLDNVLEIIKKTS